jgi:outer membrane protein OmpA-like peptidoglycan-associated protein
MLKKELYSFLLLINSLFKSGSYTVTDKAKGVLAKVAKVVNDKT